MSLLKYYNLLLFHSGQDAEIIGEDTSVTDYSSNPVEADMDATALNAYTTQLATITSLSTNLATLTRLPPGDRLTSLLTLDINGCTNIVQVPATYTSAITTLKLASTKVSSIPQSLSNLTTLDVSNCKRISSISITTLETLSISHSSVTEITATASLVRLFALNSKLTTIPDAPALRVVLWSGIASATLNVSAANSALISLVTTGATTSITSANGVVTSIAV